MPQFQRLERPMPAIYRERLDVRELPNQHGNCQVGIHRLRFVDDRKSEACFRNGNSCEFGAASLCGSGLLRSSMPWLRQSQVKAAEKILP